MKILGLILELNPPHNGHKYFIEEAKRIVSPDYTICTLSTSFCMRGLPCCIDKWQKAKIALKLGVDYVFELPSINYLQSADEFCRGSIEILAKLKVTDIAFGMEANSLKTLEKIVDIMGLPEYNDTLRSYLAKGSSYSSSALKAIMDYTNEAEVINNFALPNNTLVLGYLKALKNYPNIKIHGIKRINNNYFDQELNASKISSATAIRKAIDEDDNYLDDVIDKDYHYYKESILTSKLLDLIKYQFSIHDIAYFKDILGVSEGIENRIFKFINDAKSFSDLASMIQTKRYSLNHINRLLTNIALDNKKIIEDDYLRLIGLNKNKKNYLNTLEKEIKQKIFSSPNDSTSMLLEAEIKASKIYDIITGNNTLKDEYKAPVIEENIDE